jgi:hypothetical protein
MILQRGSGLISWTSLMVTEKAPRIHWAADKRVLGITARLKEEGVPEPYWATFAGGQAHTWVHPLLAAELLMATRPAAFSEVRVVQYRALNRLAVQLSNYQCATWISHSLHSSTLHAHAPPCPCPAAVKLTASAVCCLAGDQLRGPRWL